MLPEGPRLRFKSSFRIWPSNSRIILLGLRLLPRLEEDEVNAGVKAGFGILTLEKPVECAGQAPTSNGLPEGGYGAPCLALGALEDLADMDFVPPFGVICTTSKLTGMAKLLI